MAPGARPKYRWAINYLRDKFAPDGTKMPPSIYQPIYTTSTKAFDPPFTPDEYYKENEKDFVTGGPYLWLSKLLYERGPLTRKEIWSIYQRDKTLDKSDIEIKSLTSLKQNFLARMKAEEMIVNAGYSQVEKRNTGYTVNTVKAFEKVHPAILFSMNPWPDCFLVRKYKPLVDPSSAEATAEIGEQTKSN